MKPIPLLEPTNSETIAPITDKGTATLRAEKNQGTHLGILRFHNIFHSLIPKVLKSSISSMVGLLKPDVMPTTKGKKHTINVHITFEPNPVPNHAVNIGAKARTGVPCKAIKKGFTLSSTGLNRINNNPQIIANEIAIKRPINASIDVHIIAFKSSLRYSHVVKITLLGVGIRYTGNLYSLIINSKIESSKIIMEEVLIILFTSVPLFDSELFAGLWRYLKNSVLKIYCFAGAFQVLLLFLLL